MICILQGFTELSPGLDLKRLFPPDGKIDSLFEPPLQSVQILCQEKNPDPLSGPCGLNERISEVEQKFPTIMDLLSAQAFDIIAIHATILI